MRDFRMRTILAMPFILLSLVLTLLIIYCIGMAFTQDYTYAFIAAGVTMSDLVTIAVTILLLKS